MTDDGNSPRNGGDKPKRRRRRRRRPAGDAPREGGPPAPARADEPKRDAARGDEPPRKRRRRRRRKPGDEPRDDKPRSARRNQRASEPPPGRADSSSDVDLGWDDEPPAALAFGSSPEAAPAAVPQQADDSDVDEIDTSVRYGDDDDAPTPEVTLAADLPAEPPADDVDPTTSALWDQAEPAAGKVANIVGIKFANAGKIYRYDAGDAIYRPGQEVVVESDRGPRVGTVAVAPRRRPYTGSALKRVLRQVGSGDRRTLERNADIERDALHAAREASRKARLKMKVFRAELSHSGKKLRLYFTSDDRIDFRELTRDLSRDLHLRVEMRQIGVRDQAKMLGGIGSCGMELCCSTWLPEFAPVSIKNAKDQGLVLNPTKVSGQCGRLKCCLVYEQALYAEMRKGLPKLGKRVITELGEGRVVEVDVLRQRVRVSHVTGDIALFGAGEVEPMFPSQQPQKKKKAKPSEPPSDPTPEG